MKYLAVIIISMVTLCNAYAETMCKTGQYLNGTSCVQCPNEYPNSDAGAVSWNDCYRSAPRVECPTTVPSGCMDVECYDCPNTTDCEYRVYNGGKYPWESADGRIETTCQACKTRCLTDGCAAGKYYSGTSCVPCRTEYPNSDAGATSFNECYRIVDSASCPTVTIPDNYIGVECLGCPQIADCELRVYNDAQYPWEKVDRAEAVCPDNVSCNVNIVTGIGNGSNVGQLQCPSDYPNYKPGATELTDCYRTLSQSLLYECQKNTTVPDGCMSVECYDCPDATDCEYRVYYSNPTYPWESADGRTETTCQACKTRCTDKCAAGTYYNGTSCVQCPTEYPNSDVGATSATECYSNTKYRPWSGNEICNIPIGCMGATCDYGKCNKSCEYVAYADGPASEFPWLPQPADGVIKSGCETNDQDCVADITQIYALPGYGVDSISCTVCPENTYSIGGLNATCVACPNGWYSPFGSTDLADCGRLLKYEYGNSKLTQIYLGQDKRTSPSLAVKVGDTVFYGNLNAIDTAVPGDLVFGIGEQKYKLYDTSFDIEMPFFMTTEPGTQSIKFSLSAVGEFELYCGDNSPVKKIVRSDTIPEVYSCEYATPGRYIVRLGGHATGYSTTDAVLISDNAWQSVVQISGSLGAIFPTIGNGGPGNQPIFANMFADSGIKGAIPINLFSGIHGNPVDNMFNGTFKNCAGLVGEIPPGLFNGLSDVWATDMFYETFYGCTGLSGSSARINGIFLYDYYSNAMCSTPASQIWFEPQEGDCLTYSGASGLSDYKDMPPLWNGVR